VNDTNFLPGKGWFTLFFVPGHKDLYLVPVPVIGWLIETQPVLRYRGIDSRYVKNGARFCDEDANFAHYFYDPHAVLMVNVSHKLKSRLLWIISLASLCGTLVVLALLKFYADYQVNGLSPANLAGMGGMIGLAVMTGWFVSDRVDEALA